MDDDRRSSSEERWHWKSRTTYIQGLTPFRRTILGRSCPPLPVPVNSAYGRTGNAAEAKFRIAAGFVAAAATEPAHSSDAAARAAQPCSTGDGNKSRAGRVTGRLRR